MSSIFQFIKNPYCWIYCSYTLCILFYSETKITLSLREKCPNTDFFLVRIFPRLDWIRTDTSYLSVFSPNARKYGPEKTLYLNTFHAVYFTCSHSLSFFFLRFTTRCHLLPFVITRCVTWCHSLSFVVTPCHSLSLAVVHCFLLSLVITLCHSLLVDVPLVYLFKRCF